MIALVEICTEDLCYQSLFFMGPPPDSSNNYHPGPSQNLPSPLLLPEMFKLTGPFLVCNETIGEGEKFKFIFTCQFNLYEFRSEDQLVDVYALQDTVLVDMCAFRL